MSVFVLLGINAAYGQEHVVKGFIVVEDSVEVIDCHIEVYDQNNNLLGSQILSGNNYFEIPIDTSIKEVNIYVAQLGCDYVIQECNFYESNIQFLTIVLKNCINTLDRIDISGQRIYVKQSGDTLTYDIEGFKNETDESLQHVLERMPGIEVNNNLIFYQGKQIKKILVSGKNILNNQHKLALDAIKVEDVKNIQIIHDYKPFYLRFSQQRSEESAMNITLKDHALKNINGELEALYGVKSKYKTNVDLFSLKENKGLSIFFHKNNIGEELLSPLDYIGILSGYKPLNKIGVSSDDDFMQELLPSTDAFKEDNNLLSANFDGKLSEHTDLKASFLGFYKNAEKKGRFQSSFLDNGVRFKGAVEDSNKLYSSTMFIKSTTELSESTIMELNFMGSIKRVINSSYHRGSLNDQSILSSFNKHGDNITISPNALFSFKHADNVTSTHEVVYDYNQESAFLNYTDTARMTNVMIQQELLNKTHAISESSYMELAYKKYIFEIGNVIGVETTGSNLLQNETPFSNGKNEYEYTIRSSVPWLYAAYNSDSWQVNGKLSFNLKDFKNDFIRRQSFWLSPIFRLKYKWGLTNFVGITIEQEQRFVNPLSSSSFVLLADQYNANEYEVASGSIAKNTSFSLYLLDARQQKSNLILNCSFSLKENEVSWLTTYSDGLIVSTPFMAESADMLSLNFSYKSFVLKRKLAIAPGFTYHNYNIRRNDYGNVKTENSQFSLAFITNIKTNWSAKITGNYQLINQHIKSLNTSWKNFEVKTEAAFTSGKWRLGLSHKRSIIYNNEESLINDIVDAKLAFEINRKFTITSSGVNILGINGNTFSKVARTPNAIETFEYEGLNGAVVLGLKYKI